MLLSQPATLLARKNLRGTLCKSSSAAGTLILHLGSTDLWPFSQLSQAGAMPGLVGKCIFFQISQSGCSCHLYWNSGLSSNCSVLQKQRFIHWEFFQNLDMQLNTFFFFFFKSSLLSFHYAKWTSLHARGWLAHLPTLNMTAMSVSHWCHFLTLCAMVDSSRSLHFWNNEN